MTNMTTYRPPVGRGIPVEPQAPGDTTRWSYDAATGVLTSKQYADGSAVSYTYDTQGRLVTRTWARGIVTTYAYDACTAARANSAER